MVLSISRHFERAYCVSSREVDDLVDDCTVMAIASHFFWGCWALMQADISDIEFDYFGYAAELRTKRRLENTNET